ncbi:hypothetical protein N431DRAFT_475780 [Stipitochalara longipes BDJ]|nr:hypothetical protein N431DRAFT_475780 [Stipitochalara longipes BDJ]
MSMEIQFPAPSHRCFRCNKPATSCCAGCKDAPAPVRNDTYYCSTDCQKASWKNGHKEICRLVHTIRTLYRAGAFLQEIFYKYRERLFDHNILKVEKKNGKLYLHENERGKKANLLSLSSFVFPFPVHLCTTVADRHGIASYLSCSDALAWMHDVIKYLLKDIVSEITELEVIPQNHKREVIALEDACERGASRESYALDLSGAQYGYYDPIIPWHEYLEARVVRVQSTKAPQYFGRMKDWYVRQVGERKKDIIWAIMHLNSVASRKIMDTILAWEKDQKITVQEMLRQPLQTYLAIQGDLIGSVAKTVEDFMQELSTCGLLKRVLALLTNLGPRMQNYILQDQLVKCCILQPNQTLNIEREFQVQ